MKALCDDLSIEGPLRDPVDGVSVIRRMAQAQEYLFVLNFRQEKRQIQLWGDLVDLETGEEVSKDLTLQGLESRVFKRSSMAPAAG